MKFDVGNQFYLGCRGTAARVRGTGNQKDGWWGGGGDGRERRKNDEKRPKDLAAAIMPELQPTLAGAESREEGESNVETNEKWELYKLNCCSNSV
jgi:hypothetical protein